MVVAGGGGDGSGRVLAAAMERNAGAMSKNVAEDVILG